MGMLDRGVVHIQGRMAQDFITPLRRVCNLKFMSCPFLGFSIGHFWIHVDHRWLEAQKAKPGVRRVPLTMKLRPTFTFIDKRASRPGRGTQCIKSICNMLVLKVGGCYMGAQLIAL